MKHLIALLFICSCFTQTISGQTDKKNDSTDRLVQLNEVVISGNKFTEKKKNIIQKIDIISSRYIAKMNAQNTGDLLMSTGNVFVQKSQQGGSSPVIRGFEASRVLLVVDGIRMNNAIYRSGHLQNVITVDQNMLDRVEVMSGPSSTLFGSDALGGTIQMVTKQVRLASADQKTFTKTNAFARYSTVNNEKTGHIDVTLGYRKIGFLTSVSYNDFGDLKMGNKYNSEFPDFGRRSNYITQINGALYDTVVQNDDDRIQRFSGFKQWDILEKIYFAQSEKITHSLNMQFSNSTNVPRYDRLQDIRNNTLRFADWYYGPQKRNLYAYTFNAKEMKGPVNEIKLTISKQDIEESRQTREYRLYDRFDSRREKIGVWGAILDSRKVLGQNELNIGLDGQWNDLVSVADRTNLVNGAISKLDSRYPNGTNKMNYYGIYAQHILKMKEGKLVLNDGLRFQAVNLHSTIADNSFFNLPVTDIRQNNSAVTGNIGLAYMPNIANRLAVGFSTGFRSPNIDDMTKIFESSTSARRVVVPNTDLNPEYTYSIDVNYSFIWKNKIRFEASVYHTWFRNAIVVAPYQLNGQDSILYNGVLCQVVASQNVNQATVWGLQGSINADLTDHISVMTTLNFTQGRFKTNPEEPSSIYKEQPDGSYKIVNAYVSSKPLDHIPPVFGKTSIQYRHTVWNAEFFALYNGWKKLDQFNADGEDNAQYTTPKGSPSWFTFNFRSGIHVTDQIQLQLAIENIFDKNYRYFASGLSAPGRNFSITVRVSL